MAAGRTGRLMTSALLGVLSGAPEGVLAQAAVATALTVTAMAAGPPPAMTVALTVLDESVAEYPETESVKVAVAVLLMIVPGGGVAPCASAAKPSSMPAIRNSCSGRIMTVPAYETGAGEVTQTPPPHRLCPLLRIDLHAEGH